MIVFAEWTTGLRGIGGGGRASQVTRLDHTALDVAHAWPQFLPDGEHFLYQVVSPDGTRAGVYVAARWAQTHGCWTRPRQLTYVASGVSAIRAARDADGRPFDAVQLRLGGRPCCCPAISRRRRSSRATSSLLRETAGIPDRQRQTTVDVGRPRRCVSGLPRRATSMFNFRVSPDGQYLPRPVRSRIPRVCGASISHAAAPRSWQTMVSRRCGRRTVGESHSPLGRARSARAGRTQRRAPRAAGQRSIREGAQRLVCPLADDHLHTTRCRNEARPLASTARRRRATAASQQPFNEAQARLSPDGRWLAYVTDSTGTQEVYVRRYPEMDDRDGCRQAGAVSRSGDRTSVSCSICRRIAR